MSYKKIQISGGFHQVCPITVKINELGLIHVLYDGQIDWDKIDSWLPARTQKKIENHMCGHSDCLCERGNWQIHISEQHYVDLYALAHPIGDNRGRYGFAKYMGGVDLSQCTYKSVLAAKRARDKAAREQYQGLKL